MSTHEHGSAYEEAHTGPIKTPSQVMWASLASLVLPIFIIIGLVMFVVSSFKPAGTDSELSGVSKTEAAAALSARIAKVGSVEVRDASRVLKSGEEVYKAQCVACHAAGAAGAPKFADVAAWGARIKTGYEALLNSSLKGKGAMAAQGGGDYDDAEIARAVVYMANAGGAKFAEPAAKPAVVVAEAAAAAPAQAPAVAAPAMAMAMATTAVAAAAPVAVKASVGEALYNQACLACHASGAANAPKFGDAAAWAPRIKTGIDALTASVIKGKGAMPARGLANAASDADIRAAVEYMVSKAK